MKNKNKLFNIIMIALIVIIAVSGVLIVGNNKGWFIKSDQAQITAQAPTGVAQMERSGVGYSVEKGLALSEGDIILTKGDSTLKLDISGGHTLVLAEKTEIKIVTASEGNYTFEVLYGEVLANVDKLSSSESFSIAFNDNTAEAIGTVYSVDVLSGSANVNVYEGTVKLTSQGSNEFKEVNSQNTASLIKDTSGNMKITQNTLNETSLNDFIINQLKNVKGRKLCFSDTQLDKVLEDRQAQIKASEQERATHEAQIKAQGGTDAVIDSKTGGSSAISVDSSGGNVLTCTITIRCDTILNNMGNLTSGKNAYVPSNGVILGTSTVQFVDGETAFDVLKRACSYAGIQLEYSWTPMYNSYYIEGINNLYEFDCGSESGWMYKVNGWFPNYGCSSYTLKGGDVIVWCYTCNGLGADVGGSVY